MTKYYVKVKSLPRDDTKIKDFQLHYNESFGTIDDLLEFMAENNIPRDARICYMGCGTHTVGLEWIVEVPEPFEQPILGTWDEIQRENHRGDGDRFQ